MNLFHLTGKKGEQIAADFLKKRDFHILEKNYRTKLGEIDIIAKNQNKIHFVEVKTRVGISKGYPYESVTKIKQLRLKKAAQIYVLKTGCKRDTLSLDVVSIVLDTKGLITRLDFFENIY